MSEPQRTGALAGHVEPGSSGVKREDGPGVALTEIRYDDLVLVMGGPETGGLPASLDGLGGAPAPDVGAVLEGASLRILCTGPGQWLVRSASSTVETAAGALRPGLEAAFGGGDATVTDLGHGRTVIRVEGANARDVLAKGCPAEVDTLPDDACLASLLGPFTVVIDALGEERFDVYVFRSFGRAMWEWLVHEAAEYGCETREPAAA